MEEACFTKYNTKQIQMNEFDHEDPIQEAQFYCAVSCISPNILKVSKLLLFLFCTSYCNSFKFVSFNNKKKLNQLF